MISLKTFNAKSIPGRNKSFTDIKKTEKILLCAKKIDFNVKMISLH